VSDPEKSALITLHSVCQSVNYPRLIGRVGKKTCLNRDGYLLVAAPPVFKVFRVDGLHHFLFAPLFHDSLMRRQLS
jgi:hypothetical protein